MSKKESMNICEKNSAKRKNTKFETPTKGTVKNGKEVIQSKTGTRVSRKKKKRGRKEERILIGIPTFFNGFCYYFCLGLLSIVEGTMY